MAERFDSSSFLPCKNVGQMFCLIILLDFDNGLQSPADLVLGFNLFLGVNAIVTIPAGFIQLFAEINSGG